MVDAVTFKKTALSFPGTEETPHFDRTAFKITGRKIFATLHEESGMANMLLSKDDREVYCAFDEASIYAVPNKWGLQGWTTFDLKKVPQEAVSDALLTAYNGVLQTKAKVSKKKKKEL